MGDRRARTPEFAVHAGLKREAINMTARDFISEYAEVLEIPEEKMLHFLDCYLVGTATVKYRVEGDANL